MKMENNGIIHFIKRDRGNTKNGRKVYKYCRVLSQGDTQYNLSNLEKKDKVFFTLQMRPHNFYRQFLWSKPLHIIKTISDIYMKTCNIYLEQLILKMNFRRNTRLHSLGPLIINQLVCIADGFLSHFFKANDTGHQPANSTCRFLYH